MFELLKVLYHPDQGSNGLGNSSSLPPVDTSVSDRDILNGDDDGIQDKTPVHPVRKSTKGKQEVYQETEEGGEEGIGDDDESEESDDEESDGTSDETESDEEPVDEEDEEDSEDSDEEDSEEDIEDEDEIDAKADLVQAVKKVSPKLFKQIPGLREALVRDKEFGEIFPTIEEAKFAARNASYMEQMYKDISSGDVEKTGRFFKALQNSDKEAFEDFAHTMLDTVGTMDPQLYGSVLLRPMKKALMSMYHEALKTGNKNLAAVAIHAHNYWFDTQDVNAPLEERKKAVKTKEQEAWEREKQEYESSKMIEFKGGITEIVNHSMKLSITKELNGLKLDDYQKRNIIRDIFTGVDQVLGADRRYLGSIQSLFDQAQAGRFNSEYKSKIVRAYLQRARQALPGIRNKVLREAGIKSSESAKRPETRRMVPAGLGGSRNEDKQIDWKRVDRTRTTDMDILNGTPKYIK